MYAHKARKSVPVNIRNLCQRIPSPAECDSSAAQLSHSTTNLSFTSLDTICTFFYSFSTSSGKLERQRDAIELVTWALVQYKQHVENCLGNQPKSWVIMQYAHKETQSPHHATVRAFDRYGHPIACFHIYDDGHFDLRVGPGSWVGRRLKRRDYPVFEGGLAKPNIIERTTVKVNLRSGRNS
ncbi:hypothetical protein HGRIS_000101 [Hohenbuehelia grisea]|uniref:Uncharacterized protein n=1 Tax=Hohenbuehelia grisea TaxID=104357 RepID=A0ABR3JQ20_9AGAR